MVQWIPKLHLCKESDNYFPIEEFFVSFRTNPSSTDYCFFGIVHSSLTFTKHCFLTLILLLSARTIPHSETSSLYGRAFSLCVLITTVSFTYRHINTKCFEELCGTLRQSFIVLFFLYSFSPLIHSLLFVISSDTIMLLFLLSICLNFIFNSFSQFDYLQVSSQRISFSFGISASLCIASRCYCPLHSLLLLLFAFEIFCVFITSDRETWDFQQNANILTFTLILSFLIIPNQVTIFHLILVLFVTWVNILTPLWFFSFQRFKVNISGPWDELYASL